MRKMMGLICANYSEGNFGALTNERTIASMPFGGRYRLIDFPISNLVNSGISDVGLITPYMYRSLMDHVGAGKAWSIEHKVGGMFILPGSIYGLKNIQSKFLLRDLIQNRTFLERGSQDLVVVSSCNKVFNIDYKAVEKVHEESGNDITLIYKKGLDPMELSETYLDISSSGRVVDYANTPFGNKNCFIDAFIIEKSLILKFLDWYEALGYLDFIEIISENLDKVKVGSFAFDGYVGLINGLKSFMKTNSDILSADIRNELFKPERPIMTKVLDASPAKYMSGSKASNSIVSTGCIIEGTVENSIIFRGVCIKRGAVVRNCIIMQKSVIGENSILNNVICDKLAVISPGVQLIGGSDTPIVIGKKQEV